MGEFVLGSSSQNQSGPKPRSATERENSHREETTAHQIQSRKLGKRMICLYKSGRGKVERVALKGLDQENIPSEKKVTNMIDERSLERLDKLA